MGSVAKKMDIVFNKAFGFANKARQSKDIVVRIGDAQVNKLNGAVLDLLEACIKGMRYINDRSSPDIVDVYTYVINIKTEIENVLYAFGCCRMILDGSVAYNKFETDFNKLLTSINEILKYLDKEMANTNLENMVFVSPDEQKIDTADNGASI